MEMRQAKRGHDWWTVMNSVSSGRVKISMTLRSTLTQFALQKQIIFLTLSALFARLVFLTWYSAI